MLDDFDIKATFFVAADVVEHYPGLVESIVERGHEIGCHGLNQKSTSVDYIDTDERRLTQMEKSNFVAKDICKRDIL
ncbi:hypothetical protein C4E22_01895 [ANME-1 cluster archaeon AG-394-G06]|nr:hypothetical protein [ANME-1 cluster archaeon AG-394-G06]